MLYKTIAAALCMGSAAAWPPSSKSNHYAVLVAGSNTYGNYRHQADVCHAYQVMINGGIPAENIITMAYDDIANSPQNPYPGQIFNKPTPDGTPGTDVYAGCKIDYKGMDVTSANFVKVLTGDTSAGGPVLKSTAQDKVFVNFVDHGAVGLIAFPHDQMHATELIAALQKMHDTQMYKELVFYLEACESGSMFADLPSGINIYATTAANAQESSWGTYCMPDDKVNGKEIGSCLGDLYSVNWMEDSDLSQSGETLEAQFQQVKKLTNKSHVTEFGDSTGIGSEPITNFQGTTDKVVTVEEAAQAQRRMAGQVADQLKISSSLPSADAELASAYHRFMRTGCPLAAAELTEFVRVRTAGTKRFEAISKAVAGKAPEELATPEKYDMECHYAAHKAYVAQCGSWNSQDMFHSKTLGKLCAATSGDVRPIAAAFKENCVGATIAA